MVPMVNAHCTHYLIRGYYLVVNSTVFVNFVNVVINYTLYLYTISCFFFILKERNCMFDDNLTVLNKVTDPFTLQIFLRVETRSDELPPKWKYEFFFIVRCLRPETHNAIFTYLDLQLTNQLDPVEGSTYKTGDKGLSE